MAQQKKHQAVKNKSLMDREMSAMTTSNINENVNKAVFSNQQAGPPSNLNGNLAVQSSLRDFLDEFADAISGELVMFQQDVEQFTPKEGKRLNQMG